MSTISLNEIVSRIAALTDHRDIDMLETSLLKTVDDLVSPDWAAIYHAGNEVETEFSLAIRAGELISEPLPEGFAELSGATGVAVFSIRGRQHNIIGYLLLSRTEPLRSGEQQMMAGLFRIYDNYLTVLKDAQIDRLTGLLNRHTFDVQLDKALNLIRRTHLEEQEGDDQRRPTADGAFFLGEIDIDHFKQVNDNFGHLYGDEVLLMIAGVLRHCFRKHDLIYRFGGEEFVVIVYVDNVADAERTFERLRRSVENHAFPQVGRVTVSIGVTRILDTSVPVELMGHADQALYHAKNNGRNQACFYEELIATGKLTSHHVESDVVLF